MSPFLRLHLSQSSLDLADKISRVPRMAAGVCGIQISFMYRPKELANDVEKFMEKRLRDLGKVRAEAK